MSSTPSSSAAPQASDAAAKPAPPEEHFPELDAFLADQRLRHRSLITRLMALSALLLLAGLVTLFFARGVGVAAGAVLSVAGLVGLVRGALSLWTDIDTKARPELFAPPKLRGLSLPDEEDA